MAEQKQDRDATRKAIAAQAQARLDALAKPPGSLGRLEAVAARLCAAARTLKPATQPRALVVFAADHGAVASGVSLWPQAVSAAVVRTVLAGKAGCSVLAASSDTHVRVVDVGLATALPPHALLTDGRIRAGTRDMGIEAALTQEEFAAALDAGSAAARAEIAAGARLLIAGDIGIGNTTAAAAVTALLCGAEVATVIGPGAGANDAVLAAKTRVVGTALARARGHADIRSALAELSGLEIAAMAGFYLEAAERDVPVVLDGAISGAAALIAQALEPDAVDAMIAGHRSPEPAHAIALAKLGLEPLLDAGMRLGEGTGALAALLLIDMAAALMTEMATLDEALALGT